MLLSLLILILASALPTTILKQTQSSSTSALSLLPPPTPVAMHRHPHRNRIQKKRIWKPPGTVNNPTRVSKVTRRSRPEDRSSKRHTRRADQYRQTRIYLALKDCLDGIQKHVRNIRAVASYSINSQNVQYAAWAILQELKAMLGLFNECLERIKNGDQPLPSNKPGPFFRPNLFDICRVIAEILTELRYAFQVVQDLSGKFPIVQNICGDTLNQLSAGIANIIVASSGQLGNIIRFIAGIFQATPGFFKGLGFGFGNIPAIIAGSGHSREFDKFM